MVTWTMNDNEKLKDIINKDLDVRASDETHDRMRDIVLDAHGHSQDIESAKTLIWTRRILMKHPITKLAVAAAVVAAVLIGIGLFSNSGSGVVWAEVAQRVEASPGVIFRARTTGSDDPNDDWPNAYKITWRSAAVTRTDRYRDGQAYRTAYYDVDAKTTILLAHDAKAYMKEAMNDAQVQRVRADKERWTGPQNLVNLCLAHEHQELGQKTIDGVLCEGIEATAPNGLSGRLWVGVETGYPVLVEVEAIDDGNIRHASTLDQFQWNVDLLAEDVEPEIPTDYEPL